MATAPPGPLPSTSPLLFSSCCANSALFPPPLLFLFLLCFLPNVFFSFLPNFNLKLGKNEKK